MNDKKARIRELKNEGLYAKSSFNNVIFCIYTTDSMNVYSFHFCHILFQWKIFEMVFPALRQVTNQLIE